jgi:methylmalonyl-CoA mutase
MMEKKQQSGLLAEFDIPTYEQWLEQVEQQLKGASFEKRLITETIEGLRLQPIYLKKDADAQAAGIGLPGQYPYTRGRHAAGSVGGGWAVSQPMLYPTPELYHQVASGDVERGLTALSVPLDRASSLRRDPDRSTGDAVGQDGLSVFRVDDLVRAFQDLPLQGLYLSVEAGLAALPVMGLLTAAFDRGGVATSELRGHLTSDPLAVWALNGHLSVGLSDLYDELSCLVDWAGREMPSFKVLGIDGGCYREAGANAVQELAFALATAVNALREMMMRGLDIDTAAQNVVFSLATGPDFFMEIAKFRCARKLWAKVVKAFGGREDACRLPLAARSGRFNKTLYDPYVNLLRGTTEAFSGVLGGVDVLSVASFDALFGLPGVMGRRIARNVQIILREECHGHRVIDPAGGSWFIERLTDEMGKSVWDLFQTVESQGGMVQALSDGFIQAQIEPVVVRRAEMIAGRRRVAVGTNQYANLKETLPIAKVPEYDRIQKERLADLARHRSDRAAAPDFSRLKTLLADGIGASGPIMAELRQLAAAGATLGELSAALTRDGAMPAEIKPLVCRRETEAYEQLRRNAEAFKANNGHYPRVFLANMGSLKQHKARADFSTGFLEPGGFEVMYGPGFDRVEDAVEAVVASAAPITVICSTDETYPILVPEFTRHLRERNPTVGVVLAGYPADHIEAFKAAGVTAFIHLKSNNLAMLQELQAMAGLSVTEV